MARPKKGGESATLGWKSSRPKPRDLNDLTGVKITRADVPHLEHVDDKVDFIERMMRAIRWEYTHSARHCAAAWGDALNTIHKFTAEARRRVRNSVQDGEDAKETITAGLMLLFEEAVRDRDYRGAATVAREWAVIVGAKAPNRYLSLNATVSAEVDPKAAAQLLQDTAKAAAASAFKKQPYALNEHNSVSNVLTTIDDPGSVPAVPAAG